MMVALLGAAACSGEGPALPEGAAPTSTPVASTSLLSTTTSSRPGTSMVPSTGPGTSALPLDRRDPVVVANAFVEAWRSGDAARMRQLARDPELVTRALQVRPDAGPVACRPREDLWQCNLGTSATPHYILLDQRPTWAVYHWGEAHDESP